MPSAVIDGCRRMFREENIPTLIGSFPLVLVVGLSGLIVWMSFQVGLGSDEARVGFAAYQSLYGDPFVYRALFNTAVFSLVATFVALVIGAPASWLVERTDLPYKTVPLTLMTFGLLVPGFLTAMGWVFLLHPRVGLVNVALRGLTSQEWLILDVTTATGMGVVEGLALAPVAFIVTAATFQNSNPAYEEAAAVHGLGFLRTLYRVTLPVSFPALLAAGIYVLTIAMAAFEIPGIIGMANKTFTFSTLLYVKLNSPTDAIPPYEVVGAASTFMILVALFLSWWYFLTIRKTYRYTAVTGQNYRPQTIKLGRWKALAWGFLGLYFVVAHLLPLCVLVLNSLLPYRKMWSLSLLEELSLRNYLQLPWSYLLKGLGNTLLLVLLVPTISLFFGFPISWVVTRSRLKSRFIMDVGAFLPHVIPSVILAVGAAFAALFLLRDFIPIYGTIYILLVLYVLVRISIVTRMFNSALIRLHRELEEAAEVCGMSLWRRMRKILFPLVFPAMANAWLWVGLLTYRELSIAAFLVTRFNVTLPVAIWGLWEVEANKAAAAACLGLVGMIPLVALYWHFARRIPEKHAIA